jgi:hypothetical protein
MYEQSVVERAYAYIEDLFGLEHLVQAEPNPAIPAEQQEDSQYPYPPKSVAQVCIESARRANHE